MIENNTLKRTILMFVCAAVAAVAMAGCSITSDSSTSSTAADTSSTETADTASVTEDGYSYTLDGLVQYMADNEYISGDGTELTASAIGASSGLRFTMTAGTSTHYVELYEYDLSSEMSDMASRTVSNAKADGSFSLYDSTQSATQNTVAAVTEDGKFLMLYTNTSASDEDIDAITAAFQAFGN